MSHLPHDIIRCLDRGDSYTHTLPGGIVYKFFSTTSSYLGNATNDRLEDIYTVLSELLRE